MDKQIKQILSGRRSMFFEKKRGEALKGRDCGLGETSESVAPAKRARKQRNEAYRNGFWS
jgi:hypothetical protein